jgi:hypothetical protein
LESLDPGSGITLEELLRDRVQCEWLSLRLDIGELGVQSAIDFVLERHQSAGNAEQKKESGRDQSTPEMYVKESFAHSLSPFCCPGKAL